MATMQPTAPPPAQDTTQLYTANERLAAYTIREYFPAYTADEDLLQEARIALLKAGRTYDESRGTQFSTYAVSAIINGCRRELRRRRRYNRLPTVSLDAPVCD